MYVCMYQVDLTKYVFNTEAHPLRMFDEMERQHQDPNLRGAGGGDKNPWWVA